MKIGSTTWHTAGHRRAEFAHQFFANIYLHELDKFVVNLAKGFDRPKERKFTPEYQKIISKMEYIRKKLKTAEDDEKSEPLHRQEILRKELLRTALQVTDG